MQQIDTFMQLEKKYGTNNYNPLPVVLSQGKGCWVEDVEGHRYMDMLSAYSALNFGHSHPILLAAMQAQMEKMTLTSRAFYNDQLGDWSKEVSQLCNMQRVLPMNTGAEAVETALKIARKWGYLTKGIPRHEAEIIVCENNFHGRTISIISFSTEAFYRDDFGPFTPGFRSIPFADSNALREAITPNTAAFLVEPIQGESGINIPPDDYLAEVRDICSEQNILLMLDEIQVGLGRTGKTFCYEHANIQPDILILGKALGGGLLPISAVAANDHILGLFQPGEHGSTFGGNPLACAVSRAAIALLQEQKLAEKAAKEGSYFLKQLKAMKSPYVKDIRGKGLMVGVELKHDLGGARPYCEALQQNGMLCKETHTHVIRFAPPLTIGRDDLDWALTQIEKVLVP